MNDFRSFKRYIPCIGICFEKSHIYWIINKMLPMENKESFIKLGMMAALTAVKRTLNEFPEGMTSDQISDMIQEIDQQLGVKETEILLSKRA